jgi:hypothetical protein
MSAIKAEAARMLEKLPDDADWKTLAYRFYVRAAVEQGMAEIEAGRGVPHDQVMREMEEWLASFGQKMPGGDSSGT